MNKKAAANYTLAAHRHTAALLKLIYIYVYIGGGVAASAENVQEWVARYYVKERTMPVWGIITPYGKNNVFSFTISTAPA